MGEFDGWEKIEPPLGEGGQGKVYKARSPGRVQQNTNSQTRITHLLRQLNGIDTPPDMQELAMLLLDIGKPDDVEHLGALKILKMPEDPSERARASNRLEKEIAALNKVHHPSLLRLLHSHPDQYFFVTEFHPNGTLDHHLDRFKGRALDALEAFRPLVEAVVALHEEGVIHRDIKLMNIFVANDGHLVLGDCGIVIFKDGGGTRPTETYERVGSRDWMAPWANVAHQIALAEVNATFDIFPLGKVLWCMIAGRQGLEYWYFDRKVRANFPPNDLEMLFPDDPTMAAVNKLLSRCIVEHEENCLKSAHDLLSMVNQLIAMLRSPYERPGNALSWLCRVCGRGRYLAPPTHQSIMSVRSGVGQAEHDIDVYVCDYCKHAEVFFK